MLGFLNNPESYNKNKMKELEYSGQMWTFTRYPRIKFSWTLNSQCDANCNTIEPSYPKAHYIT